MWWLLSIVCDEFHCDPLRAEEVLERTPMGVVLDIIAHRQYGRLKAEYDALCKAGDKRCSDSRFDPVIRMEWQLFKEQHPDTP